MANYLQITAESVDIGGTSFSLSAGDGSISVDINILRKSWSGRILLVRYRPCYALQILKWLLQDIVGFQTGPIMEDQSGENSLNMPVLSATGQMPGIPVSDGAELVQLRGGRESMWVPKETVRASLAGRMLLRGTDFE